MINFIFNGQEGDEFYVIVLMKNMFVYVDMQLKKILNEGGKYIIDVLWNVFLVILMF